MLWIFTSKVKLGWFNSIQRRNGGKDFFSSRSTLHILFPVLLLHWSPAIPYAKCRPGFAFFHSVKYLPTEFATPIVQQGGILMKLLISKKRFSYVISTQKLTKSKVHNEVIQECTTPSNSKFFFRSNELMREMMVCW